MPAKRLTSLFSATGIACFLATLTVAQTQPFRLVCFERPGLAASLDKVVNAQQFLRNDGILKSRSCDFAQVPSESTARYIGIHVSPHGLLYPVYRVIYATTGQRMYATDGVFRTDQWQVRRQRGTEIRVLMPASCDVLDKYVQVTNRMPRYMAVPEICEQEIVE